MMYGCITSGQGGIAKRFDPMKRNEECSQWLDHFDRLEILSTTETATTATTS
jgi:hypothetical protein